MHKRKVFFSARSWKGSRNNFEKKKRKYNKLGRKGHTHRAQTQTVIRRTRYSSPRYVGVSLSIVSLHVVHTLVNSVHGLSFSPAGFLQIATRAQSRNLWRKWIECCHSGMCVLSLGNTPTLQNHSIWQLLVHAITLASKQERLLIDIAQPRDSHCFPSRLRFPRLPPVPSFNVKVTLIYSRE